MSREGIQFVLRFTSDAFHIFVLVLIATSVAAADGKPAAGIHGLVVNGETGQSAGAQEVRLVRLKEGMQIVAILRDTQGTYSFEDIRMDEDTPYMIQVSYQGVIYHTLLAPGTGTTEPVKTVVYDTTTSRDKIGIEQVHWVLTKEKDLLKVKKIYILTNTADPPRTYAHPDETFRFHIPKEALAQRTVSASSSGMPVRQAMSQIEDTYNYTIAYPLKPGKTQILVEYALDYTSRSVVLKEQTPYDLGSVFVLAYPPDMEIHNKNFIAGGVHPEMGFAIYGGGPFGKGQTLHVHVTGGSDIQEPKVVKVPNRTQSLLLPVVCVLSFILVLAMILAIRRHPRQDAGLIKEELFNELVRLEEQFARGRVDMASYERRRAQLKSQLLHMMKYS